MTCIYCTRPATIRCRIHRAPLCTLCTLCHLDMWEGHACDLMAAEWWDWPIPRWVVIAVSAGAVALSIAAITAMF